ncbi:uncharacterized protein M6B38_227905 [Iris pallida]|uniref:RNA ligase/cyclic nucleotide phosphodiesterase family protein n=1 Tax=Iris pallida TaxID=29817 RepID=A0AAX6DT06_IRIPA|nr:uncharacterized protein M6B38_227905 [Iris pallida]
MSDLSSSSSQLPQNPPPPSTNNHHQEGGGGREREGEREAEVEVEEGGYAIELYFDPSLENQILKAWNVLARRQISTRLISISSRPHITLLSSRSLGDPSRLLPLLRSLPGPLPLSLASVGASSSPSSLFLSPVPTAALLALHAQLCDALRREGVEAGEGYRVDGWMPNVLVADDVPRGRMAEAFTILKDLRLPVSGYAVEVGLVEFSPVREVFSFPLGGSASASVGGDA